ncbi:MAG: hypothetical protein N2Z22_04840 [Turneriella sp.]|nr:hypothetical protein [Leptospiraceae bacterium]MCX7632642.1 hypothetical protein [Turneriella sp.]
MKKSRRELFRKAIADQLGKNPSDTLGDFVSDMARAQASDDPNTTAEDDATHEEAKQEQKKRLPEQNADREAGNVMESRLKRLTAGEQAPPTAFGGEEEPPRWKKFVPWVVLVLLVLLLGYYTFFAGSSKPTIYLSNAPIEEAMVKNLNTGNLTFPKNKTLYVFFASGGRLGYDKIIARLTEVYADPGNVLKEETVAQIEGSVRATWRYFTTQFQKENFDHPGRFRVHVLAPGGEVLATQEFRIQ